MPEKNPLRVVRNVLDEATKSQDAKHVRVTPTGLDPQLARVREFQVDRIANTYRDFTAQSQYAPVMQFFQEDLYGARDYTQRDHDAERLHNFLQKFFPAEMLKLSSDAIQLSRLTNSLDATLLRVLVEQLNFSDTVTPDLYAEAYRRSDNIPDREHQIELLVVVMGDAAKTAHMLLTGPALKLAKGPAHAAGWHEMFEFLERGHHAFSRVKKPQVILDAIRTRETQIMRAIQSHKPDPFAL